MLLAIEQGNTNTLFAVHDGASWIAQWRAATESTRTADVFNPSTGQVQSKVPMAGKADVDAAVASAVEAQKGWAAWNPQRRARVMMRFVELVNEPGAKDLADRLIAEGGR